MDDDQLAQAFQELRPELRGYLTRLLVRPALADEVAQSTFVRALEALERCPEEPLRLRAWLFRIATNLAIDELRRQGRWRASTLHDLRELAESSPAFVRRSRSLVGTPETQFVAREHLAFCFACVLRRFPERKAAALLLREVHGFSNEEIASWLHAGTGQVKNWLQETRAEIESIYARKCALVEKQGTCFQCSELSGFFRSGADDDLSGKKVETATRLSVLAALRDKPPGSWHRMLASLLEELE